MEKITEQSPIYRYLEKMSVDELIKSVNNEDKKVALAIENALPQVSRSISAIEEVLRKGCGMFYMGASSGGRLSVLDKVELPNTYGIEKGAINCVLAGGEDRLLEVLKVKENDEEDALKQIQEYNVSDKDIITCISACKTASFVLVELRKCKDESILCGCIVSNFGPSIAALTDYPVEVITNPEFVTGSTRMKCGTTQKMLFDMISITVFICLGRVEDNHRMVNVRLISNKAVNQSVKMILLLMKIKNYEQAKSILYQCGDVKKSVDHIARNNIN
jgi:N-acetylmuramic acid 6-phosphate etherase